jgi:hypothetical protein
VDHLVVLLFLRSARRIPVPTRALPLRDSRTTKRRLGRPVFRDDVFHQRFVILGMEPVIGFSMLSGSIGAPPAPNQ